MKEGWYQALGFTDKGVILSTKVKKAAMVCVPGVHR